MEPTVNAKQRTEPLVELAPEEAVLPALSQSSHPVEFVESNKARDEVTDTDES